MIELRLPSFGADMEDAVFVQWNVQPGQAVRRGDIACVVETQKGAIDVEAWQGGTMARLIAAPGDRIPVGGPLALLAEEGEDWQAVAKAAPPVMPKLMAPTAEAGAAAAVPSTAVPSNAVPSTAVPSNAVPSTAVPSNAVPSAAVPSNAVPSAVVPAAAVPAAATPAATPSLRVSPAARKRATELGVDLEALARAKGGGPIALADVEQAASRAPASGMRAAIAAAMSRSKREIPHYYVGTEANVEPALRWLEAFNAQRPLPERVLFAALALRAVALAVKEAPQLNGRFVDGRFEPTTAVHVGVVTSLREGGLVVPVLHDADRLPLPDLMGALREALTRARSGRLRSSDLADATLTVTNLGDLGADTVYGVIYPPQVALVGLGRVAGRPVVADGAVLAARTVRLTLAGDHRVSDGLAGARFLGALAERLGHPETL